MEILDFTGMAVHATMAFDRNRNQRLVVVIKGTFDILRDGRVKLASEQLPTVFTDELFDSPGPSSTRYENDFATFKPAWRAASSPGWIHSSTGRTSSAPPASAA